MSDTMSNARTETARETEIIQRRNEISGLVDACEEDDANEDFSPAAHRRTIRLHALRAELRALVAS